MNPPRKAAGDLIPYALPLGAFAVLAAVAGRLGHIRYPGVPWGDDSRYVYLSQHLLTCSSSMRLPQYCWRVLTPVLVHVLPLSNDAAFHVVTYASLAAAVVGTSWFLSGLGLDRASVTLGALAAVVFGPVTWFCLWDYLLVDPLALALLVAAMGGAVRGHGIALVAALAAGALAKESALVLGAAFGLLWALDRRDWRMLIYAAGGGAAGLVALVAVHLAVRGAPPSDLLQTVATVIYVLQRRPDGAAVLLVGDLVGTWGLLTPLIALHFVPGASAWRSRAAAYVVMLSSAQLFIGGDERVVGLALPAVLAIAAFQLRDLAARFRGPTWVVWAPVLAVNAWLGIPMLLGEVEPSFPPTPEPQWIATVAITGLTLLLVVVAIWRQVTANGWRFLATGQMVTAEAAAPSAPGP